MLNGQTSGIPDVQYLGRFHNKMPLTAGVEAGEKCMLILSILIAMSDRPAQFKKPENCAGMGGKVVVCHTKTQNKIQGQMIAIEPSALSEHMDHGGRTGPCPGSSAEELENLCSKM